MSVNHILFGNDNPLEVEFKDATVNGTLTVAGNRVTGTGAPNIIHVPCTAAGPWATPINTNYHIIYQGVPGVGGTDMLVTVQFDSAGASASVATFITIEPNIPADFRPTDYSIDQIAFCYENGAFLTGASIASISNVGAIFIQAPGAAGFSGVGQTGYDPWSVTYYVPAQ